MAKIFEGVTHNPTALEQALRDMLTDLTALRAAIVAITAKLDADTTAGGTATDTDYAATCDPAALETT